MIKESEIIARIEKLEKNNTRLRLLIFTFIGLFLAGGLVAFQTNRILELDTLKVSKVILKNDQYSAVLTPENLMFLKDSLVFTNLSHHSLLLYKQGTKYPHLFRLLTKNGWRLYGGPKNSPTPGWSEILPGLIDIKTDNELMTYQRAAINIYDEFFRLRLLIGSGIFETSSGLNQTSESSINLIDENGYINWSTP